MDDYLDKRATQAEFAKLVGVSQQAISKQLDKGALHAGETLREWLLRYCNHLRDQAAGRGGSQQESLAAAKTEEAQVKTALNRLEYQKKLGVLVVADDVGYALNDWAGYANREYLSGVERGVGLIKNENGVSVDRESVKNIVGPTVGRIQGYAEKLGAAFVAREGAVQPAEERADRRVAE